MDIPPEASQEDPVSAKIQELRNKLANATPKEREAIVKELLIIYKNIPNDAVKADDPELLQKTVKQNRENQLAVIKALGDAKAGDALLEIFRNNPMLDIHPDHPEASKDYAKHKWGELRAVIEALGAIDTPEAKKVLEEIRSKLPLRDESEQRQEYNKEVDTTRELIEKFLKSE